MINREHDSPEKFISQLVNIFSRIPQIFEQNENDVLKFDNECNDLTHAIELTKFNGVQGYKMAKEIQNNRKTRREIKDHNQLLKPLLDLIKRHPQLLAEFRKCQSDIAKLTENQKLRQYALRSQNTIVEEAFKKSKGAVEQ